METNKSNSDQTSTRLDKSESRPKRQKTMKTVFDPSEEYVMGTIRNPFENVDGQPYHTPKELPELPHQPDDVPPHRDNRRPHLFQKKWYTMYPWLHFDEATANMYCFQCVNAVIKGVAECPPNNIFVRGGFRNWKKGLERFRVHENSQLHRETSSQFSMNKLIGIRDLSTAVGSLVKSVQFLVGVGYDIHKSHLVNLLNIRRQDVPRLDEHLAKLDLTKDVEKELISLMATTTLGAIIKKIQTSELSSIVVDEVKTPEGPMLAVFVRTIHNLKCEEHFLGLFPNGSEFEEAIKIVPLETLRIHLCDSALVSASILVHRPKSLGICAAHNVLHSIQDALRTTAGPGECLSIMPFLTNFFQNRELAHLFKAEVPPSLEPICPTKSVLTVKAIASVLTSFHDIANALRVIVETEPCSPVPPVLYPLFESPKLFFHFLLCKVLFYPLENLISTLNRTESLYEDRQAVDSVLQIFSNFNGEKEFLQFWHKFTLASKSNKLGMDINQDECRDVYLTSISVVQQYLADLYKSEGFKALWQLENILSLPPEVKISSEENEFLQEHNINYDNLQMEKSMAFRMFDENATSFTVSEILTKLDSHSSSLFPEMMKIANYLILARTANFKPSKITALKRFLRLNQSKEMVNELSILYAYKDEPNYLDLLEFTQQWVTGNPARLGSLVPRTA